MSTHIDTWHAPSMLVSTETGIRTVDATAPPARPSARADGAMQPSVSSLWGTPKRSGSMMLMRFAEAVSIIDLTGDGKGEPNTASPAATLVFLCPATALFSVRTCACRPEGIFMTGLHPADRGVDGAVLIRDPPRR
ncbi:hypothetical protein E1295_07395 [Nonomuraea mesophila]|uniref:Uncharacterized protein n=1 Tax=Nonomuraea mesophila TaxID=2530382 RepID=A0A4R5FVJ4_9ACTN|nr:hypothetical protein [Nonomuraea mesophila]TDE57773.1 hypothetical protein E1295_07395 [Nonomuraea mesophila]